jgi:phosphoglycolate phosphatase-like HAD superfamily hydrolase
VGARLWCLVVGLCLLGPACGPQEAPDSPEPASAEAEAGAADIRAEIDQLLDEIASAYRAGRTEEAAELAAEAYLENYEAIEDAVIERAPAVNAELEPLLGAELRRRIRQGAPPKEIAAMVERARRLLDRALAAIEERP